MQVPEGWETLTTEQILQNKKGAIKIGPFGSALKKEFFVPEGYRVFGQENVFNNDFTIGERRVDEERFQKLKSCTLEANDIVISMMGTIGKCVLVPEDIEVGIMDSHLLRLQINHVVCDATYIMQLIANYELIQQQIKRLSVGGIMAGLSSTVIKQLTFPIPPLPEQKKIAEILSTCDECIENTEKQIAKLKDLKKATMQELLTKGIGHTEFKDSPLGRIPKSWEVVKLEGVTTYSQGIQVDLSLQINEPKEGYLKFLRIENYTQLSQDFRFVPQDLGRNKFINNDDVVVVRYGATAGYVGRGFEGILANNLFKVSPNEELLTKGFIYYIILNLYECFQNLMSGGAMPALSFGMLNEIKISLPPLPEQVKITETISSIDSNIESKEQKLSKLKDQKKALMNDLLTGKVRVWK